MSCSRWPASLCAATTWWRKPPGHPGVGGGHGVGVYAFIGSSRLVDQLAEQVRAGVQFQVCANSMRNHGLDPATLPDFGRVVPAGIVALIENQQEGFAYVKP